MCFLTCASSTECNNVPRPAAVPGFGIAVSKAGGILLPPAFQTHVANTQWKNQLGFRSTVGRACSSAEGRQGAVVFCSPRIIYYKAPSLLELPVMPPRHSSMNLSVSYRGKIFVLSVYSIYIKKYINYIYIYTTLCLVLQTRKIKYIHLNIQTSTLGLSLSRAVLCTALLTSKQTPVLLLL